MKEHEKVWSVWVDGSEVNNYLLTYQEASDLADEYVEDGYSPIIANAD